jgi:5-methylcytosine-specific restriction endonuclease McrA
VPDLTKVCSRCPEDQNVKLRTEFFKNKGYKDRLYPYCKACHKQAEARPERVTKRKAYKAAYHIEHADKINARSTQWAKDNPERFSARQKRSRTKLKDSIRIKDAAYRSVNRILCRLRSRRSRLKKPSMYAAVQKAWRQRNHNKLVEYQHKRRALMYGIPFIEKVEIAVLYLREKGICGICHKHVRHISRASRDHIIPVTMEGSEHSYRNMVLAHRSCNSRKGNRTVAQQMRLF